MPKSTWQDTHPTLSTREALQAHCKEMLCFSSLALNQMIFSLLELELFGIKFDQSIQLLSCRIGTT